MQVIVIKINKIYKIRKIMFKFKIKKIIKITKKTIKLVIIKKDAKVVDQQEDILKVHHVLNF